MALATRKAGALERGVLMALMGERGSGKTTTAASFPSPVVIAIEDGTQALAELGTDVKDLPREKGQAYKDTVLAVLREAAQSEFRTVILDSATTLLDRMTEDLVKNEKPHARSLMAALGGYGKARDVLVREVSDIVEACLWLCRQKKQHVVFIMHQKVKTFAMPDRDDFDRVVPQGQADAIDAMCNPCDIVGMVEQSMSTVQKGEKVLVEGDGSRQLVVGPHPALAIKSRFHKELATLPVSIGQNPLPDIMR